MTIDQTSDPARRGVLQRLRASVGRFARSRDAATAIEFTWLALPFAALVFAILESCISFAAQEVMSNATDDIARQIRTGQFKKADITEASLKQKICDRMELMVTQNCKENLRVDLRTYATFAMLQESGFKISDGEIVLTGRDPTFTVNPGVSLSKNMLRVFYKWPVITDFMRPRLSNMEGGSKILHYATTTWQNEPFDD